MPSTLYSWKRAPWYPLDRRLGRPQSQSGCNGGEKIPCPYQESAHSLVTILTEPPGVTLDQYEPKLKSTSNLCADVHTEFHQNPSIIFRDKTCRWIGMLFPLCVHFMHFSQRMLKESEFAMCTFTLNVRTLSLCLVSCHESVWGM